jgi:release factor glutamine methyltransferase
MTAPATATETTTIATLRRALAQAFRDQGLDTPELDARVLVAHALGLDHAALIAQDTCALTGAERDAVAALAARRLAHEPVARIVGRREFWGLDLALNPATLVPRPDTETIVEAALSAVADRGAPWRLADLGTGSGALLLALLSELPAAHGIGTDVSVAALRCARRNAAALGLAPRTRWIACDFASALRGPFDLVVSNPPYVASAEIARLPPEVRDFDPRAALDGGADGLAAYRAVAAAARRILSPDGTFVLELGVGQIEGVVGVMREAGLAIGPCTADLGGIPRALTARLPPAR